MLKSIKSYQVIAVFIISWVFISQSSSIGKTPAIWGNLEPGPYAVGFKTIEDYDYSRVSRPKRDYFGRPLDGERARPIQICIWYPAVPTTELPPMVYGKYAFPYPENSRFFSFLSEVQNREIQSLHRLLDNDRGGVLDLLNVKVSAIRDATSVDGSFPLIIYSPELGSGIAENLVLCEYLASKGFIVAATHSVGMTDLNPLLNQRDLETVIRDMEYIIAAGRDLLHVNINKLGIMGYGSGGLAALLLQMRNGDIDAIASFDGSFILANHFEQARQNPYYDIRRMTSPLLQIYSGEMDSIDLSLVDSFEYSQRYSLKFNRLNHTELTSYGMLSAMISNKETQPLENAGGEYDDMCVHVFNFFNAYLNEDSDSREFVDATASDKGVENGLVEFKYRPADELPPTRVQFMSIIRNDGAAKTEEIYEKFKDSGHVFFEENVFNSIGYQFLQMGNFEDAIRIFKMNADAYPLSSNTWDSLAEACETSGRNEQAIKYLKKALQVLPGDTTTSEQLKESIKNHAEESLKKLEG